MEAGMGVDKGMDDGGHHVRRRRVDTDIDRPCYVLVDSSDGGVHPCLLCCLLCDPCRPCVLSMAMALELARESKNLDRDRVRVGGKDTGRVDTLAEAAVEVEAEEEEEAVDTYSQAALEGQVFPFLQAI